MTWKVDIDHSKIGFSVKHFKFMTVQGRVESFGGTLAMDEEDPTASSVEGWVDVASVKTGLSPRDANLRSEAFFDADRFPRMTFRSTRIEALSADKFQVYGDLTARGITREIMFDVVSKGGMPPVGGQRCWAFEAHIVLDRKAFDLQWHPLIETGGLAVSDEVQGAIEIQFLEE